MSGLLISLAWLSLFFGGAIYLAYQRIDLRTSTIAAAVAVAAYTAYTVAGSGFWVWMLISWLLLAVLIVPNLVELRREKITRPLLNIYRTMLPSMSDTEREALEAGNVWWDGELFSGMPDWDRLMSFPAPKLSAEEQAFLDGPCEKLCAMLDDWDVCHNRVDMPEKVWAFIIKHRFFAMIIPKQYGGLEFSAYANAMVITKLASRSPTASSTVGVPNSLGPAELLLHYGSDEQKQRYLPGLAAGTEIPCFALTSPEAGSDAAALVDNGVVCEGNWNGEQILGIRLNWNKRYITLAPVATVLGLAFKLYDPDHLIGDRVEYGITAALIPTNTPGVTVGRRHYPMSIAFQNGPTSGKDVFVPLDYIIGGQAMAGKGWKMLVELLSVGRAITLPSTASGGGQAAAYASGAYARIRKQFNTSIANFEGVGEALTRIAGYTYIMNAAVSVTSGAIDQGEKPAVPSAILKYHCTELGRKVANDAMDVHGGKAIMLGPKNYIGRSYMATPIAITVEGANILTRSLIIYGQGAIRCHPFVLRELRAAAEEDTEQGLIEFDDALFGHIGYGISNAARSLFLALTHAKFSRVPLNTPTRRFYQNINRYSAAFALASDFAMLTLGGALKKRELLSARLGDVLSSMYLASTVLKHFENQGRRATDLPLVEWSIRTLMYQAQESLHAFLRNLPNRWAAALLRMCIFPRGRTYSAPSDEIAQKVVELMSTSGEARERLSQQAYTSIEPGNPLGLLQQALLLSEQLAPLEKRLRQALKDGSIKAESLAEQITAALQAGIISNSEAANLQSYQDKVRSLLDVDDFLPEDLVRTSTKKITRKKKIPSKR
ncbi:MAG: acyl-CoA dehydrogenase [Gammaproteobacteria bacterium]|nr:acyl-CoA dehydrogenase [Gammaproteobacteria bacterium]MDH5303174.1 acyl-CoA dehydrogenase [Gammaproteobacteria bacterium]MDH5320818.1 acyl-CoA dehydrogenase [Gammaproteobacteria bacterium]